MAAGRRQLSSHLCPLEVLFGSVGPQLLYSAGAIFVLFLADVATGSSHGCNCPSTFAPVCGTDGKTYSHADCLQCNSSHGVKQAYVGMCLSTSTPSASCGCPTKHEPVCGSDGNTYANAGCMACAKASDGTSNVMKASDGQCLSTTVTINGVASVSSSCRCSSVFAPICGSDGTTYANEGCIACKAGLSKAHDGACGAMVIGTAAIGGTAYGCTCATAWNPVCGSDGETYSNESCMGCVTGVKKAYAGECQVATTPPSQCVCPTVVAPVCGSDGKTYSNEACMSCRAGAGVTKAADGACGSGGVTPPMCMCSSLHAPVCGSDGTTYANEGCMVCSSGVTKTKDGPCDPPTTTPAPATPGPTIQAQKEETDDNKNLIIGLAVIGGTFGMLLLGGTLIFVLIKCNQKEAPPPRFSRGSVPGGQVFIETEPAVVLVEQPGRRSGSRMNKSRSSKTRRSGRTPRRSQEGSAAHMVRDGAEQDDFAAQVENDAAGGEDVPPNKAIAEAMEAADAAEEAEDVDENQNAAATAPKAIVAAAEGEGADYEGEEPGVEYGGREGAGYYEDAAWYGEDYDYSQDYDYRPSSARKEKKKKKSSSKKYYGEGETGYYAEDYDYDYGYDEQNY
ncbi:unnamed protein product [Amoebophrya sp. A120]|nr:unnamed protein product [Amoebophrya sp. A120]|eukprot:GSA120T00017187001.1